ncbi:hypothetical protein ABXJ76_11185 [Methylobacter sp. G7]|uniref:hypothetical protein n=1 Tax=Methylobacter sp. G7 TaxID=3230117 RepID=UPI003D8009C3
MAYKDAQFISYVIDTFPSDLSGVKTYLGNINAEQDIRKRCQIMRHAIAQATAHTDIVTNSNTLKIFMAPEFYFRGDKGAYPIELVSLIMEDIRKMVSLKKYEHWIFVLGTALGYLDSNGTKEIMNMALVQKGGSQELDAQHTLIVYKEYISHIDFIKLLHKCSNPGCTGFAICNTCHMPYDPQWHDPAGRHVLVAGTGSLVSPVQGSRDVLSGNMNSTGRGREKTQSGLGGQGIFTMGGITFGLEVCLDHAYKRLRDSPPAKGDNEIQIQLIPSAGMAIEQDAVACKKKGLIFNVDGGGGGRHAHVNRNIGDYGHPYLEKRYPTPSYARKSVIHLVNTVYDWNQYFQDQGCIEIFDPLAIPTASKAT